MKTLLVQLTTVIAFLIIGHGAGAVETGKITKIVNPAHSIGIHIGDVLTRQVQIEVPKAYQLSQSALPIKGSNPNGVEVKDVALSSSEKSGKTVYTLILTYQVLRAFSTPAVMELPEETMALTGGQQALTLKLPAWRFWFAPLVTGKIETAMRNVQPQQKPSMLATKQHMILLGISLLALLVGVVSLVYINASAKWLPLMGGAFAQAHRRLGKLKNAQASPKLAFAYVHTAFNQVNGENLFAKDVDKFVAEHPKFKQLALEIKSFFEKSNQALFGQQPVASTINQDLLDFSRRLRDCERGV